MPGRATTATTPAAASARSNKINATNVGSLSLAWVYRLNPGNTITSGVFGGPTIKGTPLMVNGVIYTSAPDHVWAIDARTGREIWHYAWQSTGGIHIGNRGVALYNDWLFFETPDCNLVSLNIKDGTERWHQKICDLDMFYYGSVAPTVVKNMVIAGVSGDDLDFPGYVQAHDVATASFAGSGTWCRRRWARLVRRAGRTKTRLKHGGGMTWQPVTYDPELNHIYVAPGIRSPSSRTRIARATISTRARSSRSTRTPARWRGTSSRRRTTRTTGIRRRCGRVRCADQRAAAQAHRAGRAQRSLLRGRSDHRQGDRVEGVRQDELDEGLRRQGPAAARSGKDPQIDGALVSPNQGGATNWPSPSFSPQTGLFYVSASRAFSIYYIYDPDDNPMGWGGTDRGDYSESMIQAIDYRTGAIKWSHKWETNVRSGLLSTAGNLLFAGGPGNAIVALNATTGDALWHARLNAGVSNGPITYEMDGQQYLIVGAGDMLWAFVMNR
jgi:alcohol dehydrogenase (cytochrome c)